MKGSRGPLVVTAADTCQVQFIHLSHINVMVCVLANNDTALSLRELNFDMDVDSIEVFKQIPLIPANFESCRVVIKVYQCHERGESVVCHPLLQHVINSRKLIFKSWYV